jgi:2-polyprenyl-3-methyl-5-hydroxy-6-metoxy-1,4-benzoquinol methylase
MTVSQVGALGKRCRLCGHVGGTRSYAVPACLDGACFTKQLYRCDACSCLSADIPEHIDLRRHYATLPASYHSPLNVYQDRFAKVARYLTTYCGISQSTMVLDVGCGIGTLLERLPECKKFGIEPAESVRRAAETRGVTIVPPLEDLAEKEETNAWPGPFDVIAALDVIEHTAEPGEFLRGLDSALKPGGFLVLVTGDLGSFSARFARSRWLYFHFDEHLSFVSEPAVTSLLQPMGFSLVAKTWVQTKNIRPAALAEFVKGICKEVLLKIMPPELQRRAEERIDVRFPCFCCNMLLLYRKGARTRINV